MKKVIVIVGPTASGKTKLSILLGKKINAEIINGDSVQIYQGLDIGSAKIKENEKQGIPHHLFDVAEPNQSYTVYHFQKDVRQLIEKIKYPMIVGGTGLYIKAALYNYEFIESHRNSDFELKLQDESNEQIYTKLLNLDPNVKVDLNNRRRLIRAYEQAILGEPRSSKQKKDELLYDVLIIYLDLDRSILEKRLHERLDQQIAKGFIDEVKSLHQKKIIINAIGYRELYAYLDGKYTLEEAKEEIIKSSKKLAKKQKTWFKNQMHPVMLNALSPTLYEDALKLVLEFLEEDE
ncbi:MAG: tRNA (adenosine(37)-N6)-dimethylallyltransferase MiaA [Acholeplasmataceae bacterium]|nr:tRNA (adenosine(37)-N6)-dimethylallyltransferase MiaA [Acholeplasmataceae bacterium]